MKALAFGSEIVSKHQVRSSFVLDEGSSCRRWCQAFRVVRSCVALLRQFIVMLHPFSARAQANQAHLRIMETTDIHVNLLPYDYYADKPNDTMGLSRTASLIEAVRKEATNAMLIDNGDLLQGSPLGDYIAYEKGMKDGDVHPIMKGMNLLGYECSTLGNHEFNYGLSFLDKVIAGANFPFVCANLIRGTELASNPRDDKLYLKPYVILDQEDKGRIGRRASDQDRRDRLRAAADHDLGRQEPDGERRHPRHCRGGEGLGAGDPRGGRRHRDSAVAFGHRREAGRHDGERLLLRGRRRGYRRRFHRPPASRLPRQEGFPEARGRRCRQGHAAGQARGDGRLLGLAYGPHRPVART